MPPNDMESSSGLIMNVIRILTNSKDDAERDVIKKKLEDFLQISDEKLTKLVTEHHKELRQVMQSFTSISSNLQLSMTRLLKAKQRLKDCREMLTSKLNELRRLSDESTKNEKILSLLDQVDELSRVPTRVTELFDSHQYRQATTLLVQKQNYIEENFESFDCLGQVRNELESKREEIYRLLKEKLFIVDNESLKNDVVESLKMIDKTPELPELEVAKENLDNAPSTKQALFKFSLSSHAICFNEHYKEQIEVTKTLLYRQ